MFLLINNIILGLKISGFILSAVLLFFVYMLFSAGFSYIFYKIHAEKNNEVSLVPALKKAVAWQLYGWGYTFSPALAVMLLTGLVIGLFIVFFNPIMAIAGFNAGIIIFFSVFTSLNIMFLVALSVLFAFWQFATLCFGTEIAISKPELDNKSILQHSKNLILTSPVNFLLIFGYLVFVIILGQKFINAEELNIVRLLAYISVCFVGIKWLRGIFCFSA